MILKYGFTHIAQKFCKFKYRFLDKRYSKQFNRLFYTDHLLNISTPRLPSKMSLISFSSRAMSQSWESQASQNTSRFSLAILLDGWRANVWAAEMILKKLKNKWSEDVAHKWTKNKNTKGAAAFTVMYFSLIQRNCLAIRIIWLKNTIVFWTVNTPYLWTTRLHSWKPSSLWKLPKSEDSKLAIFSIGKCKKN